MPTRVTTSLPPTIAASTSRPPAPAASPAASAVGQTTTLTCATESECVSSKSRPWQSIAFAKAAFAAGSAPSSPITEACSNSVRHGYGDAGEGTVEILYELRPDRFVVEVADDGPGFDAQGDRVDEEDLEEGGLGIAIIKAVSDEFETSERSQGRGSRLRFVKFLDD